LQFKIECTANFHASSTPGSSNYGKHMTTEEVVDFFAPHQSTVDAVTEWLVESGISADRFAISANKQVLSLS
jgi:tripeptidyl-peptidase-1